MITLLKRNEAKAHEQLAQKPLNDSFPLRPYQQEAILAIEKGIESGQHEMLLAMAIGTGKTKSVWHRFIAYSKRSVSIAFYSWWIFPPWLKAAILFSVAALMKTSA